MKGELEGEGGNIYITAFISPQLDFPILIILHSFTPQR